MKHIFIVNNHAGKGKITRELRSILETENIEYYVFDTRKKGKEKELIDRIAFYFKSEKVRIYCCGGSGTFRNILNSISDLNNVELAFYPCGLTNDFLKIFEEEQKYFQDIRNLIHGEVRYIDFIETNHGRTLNTLSMGVDSTVTEGMDRYRPYGILGDNIPYVMAIFYSMLRVKNVGYQIELDEEKIEEKYFEICFSKGITLGGNLQVGYMKSADNGKANICFQPMRTIFEAIAILMLSMKGKLEESTKYGGRVGNGYSSFSIRRKDGKAFLMNMDGEIVGPYSEWKAQIVHKGIKFVVPKQITKGFEEGDGR